MPDDLCCGPRPELRFFNTLLHLGCQAVATDPVVDDLCVVDPSVDLSRVGGKWAIIGGDHICHLATAAAHEVVMGLAGDLISGGARSSTGSHHQPGPSQIVQRVENRGTRYGGTSGADPGENLIGGGVTTELA